MNNSPDITRGILLAYGYTPETLAIDLEVSQAEAHRILHGKARLRSRELCLLCDKIAGVTVDFLCGAIRPGQMKATLELRKAAAQKDERREREERQAQRDAELEAMTPAELCASYAATLVNIATVFGKIKHTGFTLEELLAEFHRQLDVWEGAA